MWLKLCRKTIILGSKFFKLLLRCVSIFFFLVFMTEVRETFLRFCDHRVLFWGNNKIQFKRICRLRCGRRVIFNECFTWITEIRATPRPLRNFASRESTLKHFLYLPCARANFSITNVRNSRTYTLSRTFCRFLSFFEVR